MSHPQRSERLTICMPLWFHVPAVVENQSCHERPHGNGITKQIHSRWSMGIDNVGVRYSSEDWGIGVFFASFETFGYLCTMEVAQPNQSCMASLSTQHHHRFITRATGDMYYEPEENRCKICVQKKKMCAHTKLLPSKYGNTHQNHNIYIYIYIYMYCNLQTMPSILTIILLSSSEKNFPTIFDPRKKLINLQKILRTFHLPKKTNLFTPITKIKKIRAKYT